MRGGTTRPGQVLRRVRGKRIGNRPQRFAIRLGDQALRQAIAISLCDDELYCARVTLPNSDDSVEVSGVFGWSSCTACFALLRLRDAGGLTTDAGASSAFMERR